MAQIVGRIFRSSTAGSWRQSVPAFIQTRSYANSAVPTFTKTSSAELDKALKSFREKLFIPYSLPKGQREGVFKEKHAKQLSHEPVTVKVSDTEEYTLRPMSKRFLPSKKKAVAVLRLMASNHEWKHLIQFLTGLRTSNRILSADHWEWLIRKLSQANKLDTIIVCARQSERTGLRLNNVDLVERLFKEIHRSAQNANFKGEGAAKALSLAQQAVRLMETPQHSASDPKADPKRSPVVIGTMLELVATRSLNELAAKDECDEVATYARRLMASWPLLELRTDSTRTALIDEKLQAMLPIWNGMQKSLLVHRITKTEDVYGPLKSGLEDITKAIKTHMAALPAEAKQKPLLGYNYAELLFKE